VSFPQHSPPWDYQRFHGLIPADAMYSLRLHPTQIYSALDALVIFILLSAYYPLRRRDGEVMGLLMITYPITRFLIEWLRNDEGVFFAGLTISQNISVVLFVCGFAYWFWLSRLPRARHADVDLKQPTPRPMLTPATS
jgi:phosphatidylglycerol:prolipoprotein diacylglycerol transferase